MGLYVDLRITATYGTVRLGLLEILRTEHLIDKTNPADEEHSYDVRVYDEDMKIVARGTTRHRYGDGAWVLVAKAMEAAKLTPSLEAEFETFGTPVE